MQKVTKIYCRREPLNSGGYTGAGEYYGRGAPLYRVTDENGSILFETRAHNKAEALADGRERGVILWYNIPTIYEIKRNAENAGLYFSRETLRFFGQTLRSFKVYRLSPCQFLVAAPIMYVGRFQGVSKRVFDASTNLLERVQE